MDEYIKNRISKLTKSMQKSIKKVSAKDAIDDVLDSNRIAEINPDEVPAGKTGVLNKSKKKKKLEKCGDDKDCDCEKDIPADFEKGEKFVKDMLGKFEAISSAYLKKMELLEKGDAKGKWSKKADEYKKNPPHYGDRDKDIREAEDDESHVQHMAQKEVSNAADKQKAANKKIKDRKAKNKKNNTPGNSIKDLSDKFNTKKSESLEKAKSDEFETSDEGKRQARKDRGNVPKKSGVTNDDPRAFKPHKKENPTKREERSKRKLIKEPKAREGLKTRLTEKYGKQPKKEDLELPTPLAASEKVK